ncbi:hypothetical protein B0H12DRAFT_770851 [Mycena haematopus]|nr:hypothetical protein B0H12DRAFT_770851 [Mycena haematopus]
MYVRLRIKWLQIQYIFGNAESNTYLNPDAPLQNSSVSTRLPYALSIAPVSSPPSRACQAYIIASPFNTSTRMINHKRTCLILPPSAPHLDLVSRYQPQAPQMKHKNYTRTLAPNPALPTRPVPMTIPGSNQESAVPRNANSRHPPSASSRQDRSARPISTPRPPAPASQSCD